MIPFGLLSGVIKLNNGLKPIESLEIRVLELSEDFLTFRAGKKIVINQDTVAGLGLYFYESDCNYIYVEPQSFEIIRLGQEEYYNLYKIIIRDEAFLVNSRALTEKYLNYIQLRMDYDFNEVSEHLTGYPALEDEKFFSSLQEQRKAWNLEIKAGFQTDSGNYPELWNTFEYGVSLNRRSLWMDFLENWEGDYLTHYFEQFELSAHPISKYKCSEIIIGNDYCPNIFPTLDVLRKLVSKAKDLKIVASICLAPLGQTHFERYIKIINEIQKEELEINAIYANDLGTYEYLKENTKLVIKKGSLFYKYKRDPRMKYIKKRIPLSQAEDFCYLPYAQTNTGTFCPVSALAKNGQRGKQARVKECDELCAEVELLYPKHLYMKGQFNSLFTFCIDEMRSLDLIENFSQDKKIILNL